MTRELVTYYTSYSELIVLALCYIVIYCMFQIEHLYKCILYILLSLHTLLLSSFQSVLLLLFLSPLGSPESQSLISFGLLDFFSSLETIRGESAVSETT